jgi:mRNA-degrading endonuclease toxin of MazEF toxin-antitoxin module
VRFPYADLQRWGKRPALIVQSGDVRTELGHWVLAQITSSPRTGVTRIPIDSNSAEGRAMGLLMDSVILVDVLQTVDADLIEKRIGTCPAMEMVDKALRELLAL